MTENLIALLTLTALEIVLGIDNIVFITILVGRLPEHLRTKATRIGLGLALGMRLILLLTIKWVIGLTKPLFEVMNHAVSGRDLVLLIGGLFLIGKSTHEIHAKLEGPDDHAGGGGGGGGTTFGKVLVQIALLDIVFSLDSVITAVGMAKELWVMIAAVVISMGVMLFAAVPIGRFVEKHPTFKMLGLSFLLLIGVMLVAEGMGQHINKGYIYFAMGFSLVVEVLNMKLRKGTPEPVQLHSKLAVPKLD